jgi:hypothetical protein
MQPRQATARPKNSAARPHKNDQVDGGEPQQGQHHAQEIAGAAVFLPATKADLGTQFAGQPRRIAQGGGDFLLGPAVGRAVGEMAFIIGQDVADIGMVQTRKPVAKLRHEVCAVHAASPKIFRTAASKISQSEICAFSAWAPLLVSL